MTIVTVICCVKNVSFCFWSIFTPLFHETGWMTIVLHFCHLVNGKKTPKNQCHYLSQFILFTSGNGWMVYVWAKFFVDCLSVIRLAHKKPGERNIYLTSCVNTCRSMRDDDICKLLYTEGLWKCARIFPHTGCYCRKTIYVRRRAHTTCMCIHTRITGARGQQQQQQLQRDNQQIVLRSCSSFWLIFSFGLFHLELFACQIGGIVFFFIFECTLVECFVFIWLLKFIVFAVVAI